MKADVPTDLDNKKAFAKKLMVYNVSLVEYLRALQEDDIV